MTTSSPEQRVILMRAADLFEAYTVLAVLEEAGIDGYVLETTPRAPRLGPPPPEPTVPVQVRRPDLEAAQAAIAEHVADTVDLDWDEVDVGTREDQLPLRTPGRVPAAARVAFAVALLVALLGAAGAILSWFV